MTSARVNAELKARCPDPRTTARRIRAAGARWTALERQTDTYYSIREGRLKLREVGRRALLVRYFRGNALRTKRSDVLLLPLSRAGTVKRMLGRRIGVRVVVEKVRRVYLKGNVRIHLDDVRGLGRFVEIEAVGPPEEFPRLRHQAEGTARAIGLRPDQLVRGSYSDLLLQARKR